jgi:hypothetical protein
MLEIEEKIQLEKEVLKTLRLLDIVTHPEKLKRLDKKLQHLFKKLQVLEDLHKIAENKPIPLPSSVLANTSEISEES